jgi:predicted ArsR family transcriptional regulator
LNCRQAGALNLADVVACLDAPRAAIDVVDLLGLDEETARATLRRARRLGLAEVVGVRSYPVGRPALLWGQTQSAPAVTDRGATDPPTP